MRLEADGLYHISSEDRPSRWTPVSDPPNMILNWHDTRCYQECIIHSKEKQKTSKQPYKKKENQTPKGGRKQVK